MKNGVLTDNEFWILDTIAAERGEAYLASIRRIVRENREKDISYGRQADILDKFERAHLVEFRWSSPTDKPGGRSKKLYTITGEGRAVLQANYSKRKAIQDMSPGLGAFRFWPLGRGMQNV